MTRVSIERPKRLCLLGATGSIGRSTLDVVGRHPERFQVVALTGHTQAELLAEQCRRFRPEYVVVGDSATAALVRDRLRAASVATEVLSGREALVRVACLPDVDCVVAAIVGAAGLPATFAAVEAGKDILLANKESLVVAGELFMAAARRSGSQVLPVDSEHNAIFQCLPDGARGGLEQAGVTRLLLTASGGPFRTRPLMSFGSITPEEACAHPNWSMGRKISVDSATMMNKGLEVIEARWLFDAAPEAIQVVIHPQSVVHSLVQYRDGSVLAQLGNPDMRTPIANALAYPDRIEAGVASLDLFQIGKLDFERPDHARFPCLGLAYQALEAGQSAPAILNAANEVAVEAFLLGQISFVAIASLIRDVLDKRPGEFCGSIDALMEADRQAREAAWSWVRANGR